MLADLARRDGQSVVAFDLFGDRDLHRSGARRRGAAGREPGRAGGRGGGGRGPAASSAGPASRPPRARRPAGGATPAAGQPAADATRRARPAPGSRRRCATPASRSRAPSPRAPADRWRPLAAQAAARGRGHARAGVARRRPARRHGRAGAHQWGRVLGGGHRRRGGRGRARDHRAARGQRAFGGARLPLVREVVPPRLPAGERDALLGQARAICSHLAGAFALRGLFGVDLVWDGERAWTIEVNPRPTASLEAIEAAHGSASSPPTCGMRRRASAGRAAPGGSREGRALRDRGRGRRRQRPVLERGVRDVPPCGERIAAGRPFCTVVATGTTPDEGARMRSRSRPLAARGARGAPGGGGRWLTRRAPGCGCACDDIEATIADGPAERGADVRAGRRVVRRAGGRARRQHRGPPGEPRRGGRRRGRHPAPGAGAARVRPGRGQLRGAAPGGGAGRGGRRDRRPGRRPRAGLAFQAIGSSTATFGEIRDRPQLVVAWRADPAVPTRACSGACAWTAPSAARGPSSSSTASAPRPPRRPTPSSSSTPRDFEALWALRALVAGAPLDRDRAGDLPLDALDELAERLRAPTTSPSCTARSTSSARSRCSRWCATSAAIGMRSRWRCAATATRAAPRTSSPGRPAFRAR